MRVLVSYDIDTTQKQGRSRLRKVARVCKDYGVRVQYSIFECAVPPKELVLLKSRLVAIVNTNEDSLRLYFLSEDDAQKTEHYGVREPIDPTGTLVV